MANFHSGRIQPKPPEVVEIGDTVAQILPFRYSRAGLTLTNVSENFITIRLDGTANIDMYSGITLTPGGGVWTMDEYTFTNEKIYARATGAGSTLCIQEFIDGGTAE